MASRSRARAALPAAGVVTSAFSVQAGAALGATVIPLVGPLGVVGMRQLVAAISLTLLARPPLRRLGARRLLPAVLLGLVLVGMNLSLYSALQRIGLGLAVTIEFLGPLGVAVLGAARGTPAARRAASALLALVGVVLVTDPFGGEAADPVGVALALVAGGLWASYILLTERAGALPGITGTAVASLVGSLLTLPVLVVLLTAVPAADLPRVVLTGCLTGLLSSALPYSLDMVVLRLMPRSLFGVLQSIDPVAAALFGLLLLGQALAPLQIAGIAAVCVANAVALVGVRTPGTPPPPDV